MKTITLDEAIDLHKRWVAHAEELHQKIADGAETISTDGFPEIPHNFHINLCDALISEREILHSKGVHVGDLNALINHVKKAQP